MSQSSVSAMPAIARHLPPVRGKMMPMAALAAVTWFRVGGPADMLFMPEDAEDLAAFLKGTPADIPITVVGVGSNLLVRDSGIEGVVIRLGKGFSGVRLDGTRRLRAGAAALDVSVAKSAFDAAIGGLEFYRGIPGSIGGALRMNAGAYGRETKDVVREVVAIDRAGERHVLSVQDMGFQYRRSGVPDDLVFVEAVFEGEQADPPVISARMDEITASREATQPVKSRTGGSTFKNPDGAKAWQLIDQAGCRGLTRGDAQVSDLHCNFLINRGQASAEDLEALAEDVRRRVQETSGVTLEWEIKRLGRESAA